MPMDPTIAIRDCLAEIAILNDIAARMTLQSFRSDPIARRAAAYSIQTISEAVRRTPDDWLAEFPTEPWAQIKGIGNRIRHEYFCIDHAILWGIVTTEAPGFRQEFRATPGESVSASSSAPAASGASAWSTALRHCWSDTAAASSSAGTIRT
jgi:uncharacterized protein with HEPN domain